MAFGLKYELLCTTRKGNLYKAKIYFDGYVGNDIDRDVPVSPFKLRKDKAAVIRGTSFEFSIREEVDFEFLEFYTNSNKKVKVELYDPSDNLIWVGFNLPQQYQVPYVPPPANVTFTATDGLGLLKSETFTLTGRNSQLAIICHCIDKIGLVLGYSISINLFEITHDHSRSPLAQTYEDSEIFDGLNCYEVVEKILNKYNAEITQRRGKWAITRSVDKKSSRMLYSSAGVYETTEAAPVVLDLGLPGAGIEVSPRGSLQMSLEPGGKKVKISHNFGRKGSILTNSDFSQFASAAFPGWSKTGSFTPEQRFNDNGPFAFIPGNNDTSDCLYQAIDVENAPGDDFVFQVEMGVLGYKLYGGLHVSFLIPVQINIALVSGGITKFLAKDGETGRWVDELTTITMQVGSQIDGTPKMNSLQLITHEIPFSGTLQVTLYRIGTPQLYQHTYTGVAFGKVNLFFVSGGELYPAGVETLASFTNSTEPSDLPDISLLAADAPDLANTSLLYKNITWLSDGSPTSLWHRLGSASEYSILHQLALTLASNNRVARQKLSGEIKGIGIAFDSIIKDGYNDNREFEIAEGTWDIYLEVFNVTLLELLPWSDETVELTTVNLNSSGSSGSSSSSGGGVSQTSIIGSEVLKYFELVNPGGGNEYVRLKLPLAVDLDIQAYSNSGQFPSTIWADMPIASASVLGGIKIGTGLTIDSYGVLNAAAGSPGAGTWGSITGNIGDQVDLTNALAIKLNSSSYTAADVLSKLLTVDGSGSGLDADLLDGYEASYFVNALAAKLNSSSYTAADVISKLLTVDGSGSGLDADLLDGHHASYFAIEGGSSFTSQIIYGGSSANDDITLRGTSHATKTSSYVVLADVGAGVLVGTTSMSNGYFMDINGNLHVTGNIIATGEITAFSSGAAPGDFAIPVDGITMAWDGTPKSLKINASVTGNASKFLRVNSGETGVEWVTPPAGMVYPAAGIPLSNGSGWDTSITNNSGNWNTAYGWGNHASAGYVTGTPWTSMGYATYPSGTGIAITTGSAWGTTIAINTVPVFGSAITGTPDSTTYLRGDGSWSVISTGVIPTDNILDWDAANSWYAPYSAQAAGKFDISTTAPYHNTRLNYDGMLYAKEFIATNNITFGGNLTAASNYCPAIMNRVASETQTNFSIDKNNTQNGIGGAGSTSIGFIINNVSKFLSKSAANESLVPLKVNIIQEYTTNSGITFSQRALTVASTTSYAGFRIPHGTAPTSPVDGDIWTTTAGLYIRINGTTVGPLN